MLTIIVYCLCCGQKLKVYIYPEKVVGEGVLVKARKSNCEYRFCADCVAGATIDDMKEFIVNHEKELAEMPFVERNTRK